MEFGVVRMDFMMIKNDHRAFGMGVAIVLVILYHLVCVGFGSPIFMKPFAWGYIGVDIFMFWSALGLCYSYKKNNLSVFYKRRLLRIFPLFLVGAIACTCVEVFLNGKKASAWDWVCNLSTLNYYQIGGFHFEWYIASLLLLYAFFPLLFLLVDKFRIVGVAFFAFVSFLILYIFDIYWTYDCLIARLPIFCLGIYFYFCVQNGYFKWFYLFAVFGVCFSVPEYMIKASRFLFTALLTPVLLVGIIFFRKVFERFQILAKINECFDYLGSKTMELYIANIIVLPIMTYIGLEKGSWMIPVWYLSIQVILSIILIKVNNLYGKC